MRRVAITDVAAAAGVSRSTVSNFLNRPDLLADETRRRIEAAVHELGFVPSDAARKIGSGDTATIGYIAFDLTNPFAGVIADAIERRAIQTGRTVMVGNSAGSAARQLTYLDLFESKRVGGVIIASLEEFEPQLAAMRRRGTPSVITGRMATNPEQPSVSVADADGGYLAARHLLDLGRRRIVFVGASFTMRQISERFDGASRAVREVPGASLEVIRVDEHTITAGHGVGAELTSRGGDQPDGVFAANDLLGLGVVSGLMSRGAVVPDDVAVIGYDDDEISGISVVPLSSIRTPGDELGVTAVDLMLHQIGETTRDFDSLHQVIAPSLVARQSTAGPVPAAASATTATGIPEGRR